MIVRYHKEISNKKYDSIIIGSGIGGMTTAGILARQGQRVLVLEKHYLAGGLTHTFKRKRFEWDVGLHYIGNVHNTDHIVRQTFDYVSDEKLRWCHFTNAIDHICIDDNRIEITKGKESFIETLCEVFPEERIAIETYVKIVCGIYKSANYYFAERLLPPWLGKILYPFLAKGFRKYSDRTTLEVLSELTNNKELINILTARYGNYGLPPSKSSFAMHALVVNSYLEGANYPIGGTSEISNTISRVIASRGGCVATNADVKQIIVKDDRAMGVLMADGNTIFAKNIISNAGYDSTFRNLLPHHLLTKKKQFIPSGNNIKPSVGHMALYVGLEGTAEELGLDQGNHWLLSSGDQDQQMIEYMENSSKPFPVVFISSSSAKDPNWAEKNSDISTLSIIVPASFDWFEKWKDLPWKKRGEEYDSVKLAFGDRLLEHMYKQLPKTKGKVQWQELSTPLSTAHFCQRYTGEMYGFEHSPIRFKQRWLRPSMPVKNLYLVGQDIVTVGVGASLLSAVLTTSLILRKNMMSVIPKAQRATKEAS